MKGLNKQQREAVHASANIVYVDAGPGTGKSTVIVARVKYLICTGIAPKEILVLAFNTKVVDEFKEKLKNYVGIKIFTFHSFGMSIIKQYKEKKKIKILSDGEQSKLITQIKKDLAVKNISNREVWEMLTICRENPCHLKKYSADLQAIYKKYVEYLKREKLFDYPKLIRFANVILQKEMLVNYKHILVDEFQDASQSRLKLLRLLTCNTSHLFVVGDSDQQILEWAGVRNNNLEQLKKYYSNVKIYMLESSYRLTPQIAMVANNLIRHGKNRMAKTLRPLSQQSGYFEVKKFDKPEDESQWCVQKINFLLRSGVDKKDIAVLVRQEKMLPKSIIETGVVCSTIHKAKGLEFQHVIVLGVERGIFMGNIEEERRVLYVAMTRAIKSLVLTYIDDGIRTVGSEDKRVQKSPFIDELYK